MQTPRFCLFCAAPLGVQTIEQQPKLACTAPECSFVHWDNPTPVALVIVEWQQKWVITRNSHWPEWKYSFISGFVDTQETPLQAAQREVSEELALTAITSEFVTLSLYQPLNQLMLGYSIQAEGELRLNHENSDYKLLTLEELAAWPFGQGATPIIQHWLKSRLY